LISVSDKRGIVPFAQGLVNLGWDIISTGGTHAALKAGGVPVQPVDKITGFPRSSMVGSRRCTRRSMPDFSRGAT
jgi:phosphoribosylaminoimidazolecarboxamide formyltransferase/IMP cyclohydrolase